MRILDVSATVANSWQFLKKLNIPYEPIILLLGMCMKELKTDIQTNSFICMFIIALFTIAKRWKQFKYP